MIKRVYYTADGK